MQHQQPGFRPASPLQKTPSLTKLYFRIRSSMQVDISTRTTSPPPPPLTRRVLTTSPKPQTRPPNLHLRRLTSRIVELTRRKQLRQIFEEVQMAKKRYGKLNTIVMNSVMEACVRCSDVDAALRLFEEMSKPGGCGVDDVSFGTLLKGLGEARRVDEAFQILESVEQGTADGSPKLSSRLIYGLLNALLETGDMRRANGLLARYRLVFREEGHSILLYNLLMKGYANTDFPLGALAVRDEILRQGLKPDKLSYNTLIFACVKAGRMDVAMGLFAEMKEEAQRTDNIDLNPDSITYTILLKGIGSTKDLVSVQKLVMEMKSSLNLFIDRVAYAAMVDTFLACGSTKGALCIFGELLKRAGEDTNLKPKPHLYLAMMREFAVKGNFGMVKNLHMHMWSDSSGTISLVVREEADELLMEAAINGGQVHVAKQILSNIVTRRRWNSWTSRGGMIAVRVEALSGFKSSLFSPYILHQVSLVDPIEKYMTAFKEANPLHGSLELRKAVMRFYRDEVVPVIDDWGSCIGIVHREDCDELDASLSTLMRGPPPCVTTSTSTGRVIDLLLEKRYKMVVVVRSSNVYETSYSSSSRPVGVFTYDLVFNLALPVKEPPGPSLCRTPI